MIYVHMNYVKGHSRKKYEKADIVLVLLRLLFYGFYIIIIIHCPTSPTGWMAPHGFYNALVIGYRIRLGT